MKTESAFLRGSRVLQPINHIVIVESLNSGLHLRRVSLTAEQMGKLEARLMVRQHAGGIRSYIITAAEDCTVPELLSWVESFSEPAQQPELLSVAQDTLFTGGER